MTKKVDGRASVAYMSTMSTTIKRLKELRGGSQKELAAILGISHEHLSRIANGKFEEPETFKVILELLESSPPNQWPPRWRKVGK